MSAYTIARAAREGKSAGWADAHRGDGIFDPTSNPFTRSVRPDGYFGTRQVATDRDLAEAWADSYVHAFGDGIDARRTAGEPV